jgi:hypothetical protein
MSQSTDIPVDDGLEVVEIASSQSDRPQRSRDVAVQMEGIQRIAQTFVQNPESILQELVNTAVDLCGADSAGISIEMSNATDARFYHWVATAGQYTGFLDAVLPRYPSACGITLERGRPQFFRVGKPFFDIMGIEAPLVTDGILLPWKVDGTRGTIFVMAHGRTHAFDEEDCRLMQVFAEFSAMGVRQHHQQQVALESARVAAAAAMANDLAHQINNPLQSLTNMLFLAAEGHYGEDARTVGAAASADLERLGTLVQRILALSATATK